MGLTLKIIFRKINKDGPLGYVFLQRIEYRKSTIRSLKLPPFDIKYWNKNSQRVKKTKKIDYLGYNDTIEKALSDVLAEGKSFRSYDGVNSRLSYLHFYENELNRSALKDKHGTRLKYTTVYKKLTGFLLSNGKSDLLFSELSQDFLDDFRIYMKKSGLETNTTIHYLKILKVIFGKAEKDRSLIIGNNPFYRYQFERKKPKTKETLYPDDITKLLDAQIASEGLAKDRDLFLFQFFSGGMRVSDLVTLRYSNLKNGRIAYNMFKTDTKVDIAITDIILDLLKRLLALHVDVNDTIENLMDIDGLQLKRSQLLQKTHLGDLTSSPYGLPSEVLNSIPLSICIDKSYWVPSTQFVFSMNMEQLRVEHETLTKFIESKGIIKFSGYAFNFSTLYEGSDFFFQELVGRITSRIKQLRKAHLENTVGVLNEWAIDKDISKKFVFGMLKDADFDNIGKKNDFSIASEEQYKKINVAGIVYNRSLKQLPKLIGIDKTFSTHLPRTSFANIMMNSDATSMDISKALGHSSLSVTDEYLKTGFNDGRTDDVLRGLGDKFKS